MIPTELLEHLVKEKENFYGKVTSHYINNADEDIDRESSLFQGDFLFSYKTNFLDEIYDIYFQQKNVLEKDLKFYQDSKSKEDFFFSEIQKYRKEFESNEYNYIFTLDNFHNEFFDVDTFNALVQNLFMLHDEINDLYTETPKSQIHLDEIDNILEEEFFELKKIAGTLIILKLIHFEQKNNQQDSVSKFPQKKHSSNLTLNQKVLLIEKLLSSNKWASLTQVRQIELIFLITNQSKDNIKTALRNLTKKPSEKSPQEIKDFKHIEEITNDLV